MASSGRRRLSLPGLLVLAFALSLVAAVLGWRLGKLTNDPPQAEATTAAWTRFRLPDLSGREVGPADFAGQVVVVEFWATWCAPCRVQARILHTLFDEFHGRGVEFLAVSLGENEETVRAFALESPFPYPVLFDAADSLSGQAGIYALPTVLVLDREGSIVYFEPGISHETLLRRVLEGAGVG